MASDTTTDVHAKERQSEYRQPMVGPETQGALRKIKAPKQVTEFAASVTLAKGFNPRIELVPVNWRIWSITRMKPAMIHLHPFKFGKN